MAKINYTVIIILAVIGLVAIYIIQSKQRAESQARMLEAQVSMIDAQTRQQEACQDSWVCATTSILTGVGDVAGGFLGGLFGK